MKLYTCPNCGNTLYFENTECLHCKRRVGFDPRTLSMVTLEEGFRYCQNAQYSVCNWLLPTGAKEPFCVACSLNRTVPGPDHDPYRIKWREIEMAKHRLIYSLLRLRLPFEKNQEILRFDFKEDMPYTPKVITGHDNGLITINLDEADEAQRVRSKQDLGERYRTVLGHFRHETGHFYWDVLIRDSPVIERFRQLFGEERWNYAISLQNYYANGAQTDWMQYFVSRYAAAHPWEDWAETWANYLHMMDTLETAWSFGISVDPLEPGLAGGIKTAITEDPYGVRDFDHLVERWLPLSFAVNSLNQSMGHPDFYPFILSNAVVGKLAFIHGLVLPRQ
jgi:hypothetical protein